ncbi:MAG TPA: hypothetical protein V6C63_07710 [Allocoleopsis sp.]
MKTSFTCPLPPTLNEIVREARGHWSKGAKQKKFWTKQAAIAAHGLPKFPDKVWLSFDWLLKSRRNDPDNVAAASKFLLDALTDIGVLTKDSLMVIQSPIVHHYAKGNDEVIVTVSDRPIYTLILNPDETPIVCAAVNSSVPGADSVSSDRRKDSRC